LQENAERRDTMQQFKMREMAITGTMRYREYFCPEQLLRQKEIAAGFFYHHFRHRNDIDMYHTEMFYLAAFMQKGETDIIAFFSCRGYYPVGVITLYLDKNISLRKSLLRQHFQEEKQYKLLQDLWEVSRGAASLSQGDKNRLFCLLVAGYSLAGKTLEECPISAEAAENAFLNRSDVKQAGKWLVIPDSGDIPLEARKEPYRILVGAGARERLLAGMCITQRKFVALPHAQLNSGVPVTLLLYTHEEDPNPAELTVGVGDYCYANFVGNVPVWFHPAVAESETCRIERKKRRIIYTDKIAGRSEILESPTVEPVGFAAEQNAAGWLLLYDGKLSVDMYSRKNHYLIHREHIVQVEFRGDKCLLLDMYGTVYTNYGEKYPDQLISLDGFSR